MNDYRKVGVYNEKTLTPKVGQRFSLYPEQDSNLHILRTLQPECSASTIPPSGFETGGKDKENISIAENKIP